MTGAVSFHLFTPLGVDPNNDGGGLFAAAVTIWVSAIVLLIIRRNELVGLARRSRARFRTQFTAHGRASMRAPAHA